MGYVLPKQFFKLEEETINLRPGFVFVEGASMGRMTGRTEGLIPCKKGAWRGPDDKNNCLWEGRGVKADSRDKLHPPILNLIINYFGPDCPFLLPQAEDEEE